MENSSNTCNNKNNNFAFLQIHSGDTVFCAHFFVSIAENSANGELYLFPCIHIII